MAAENSAFSFRESNGLGTTGSKPCSLECSDSQEILFIPEFIELGSGLEAPVAISIGCGSTGDAEGESSRISESASESGIQVFGEFLPVLSFARHNSGLTVIMIAISRKP